MVKWQIPKEIKRFLDILFVCSFICLFEWSTKITRGVKNLGGALSVLFILTIIKAK